MSSLYPPVYKQQQAIWKCIRIRFQKVEGMKQKTLQADLHLFTYSNNIY